MARRTIIVAAVVVALGLLGVGLFRPAGHSRAAGSRGSRIGQLAPPFETTDLNGQPIALQADRGRRVVLNFWASWCVPCRAEFPVLKRLLARQPDVVVLGVVFQDSDGPARAFLRAQGGAWPGVRDPKGQIADAYDVHAKPGIPVSILVDPSGHVRDRRFGPLTGDGAADAFVNQAPGR